MGLFSGPEEQERKARLKSFEDKRVAFAEKLERQGFKPDKMLFAQSDNGGFVAVCRFEGKLWLIASPGFGTEEDYVLAPFDVSNVRREEVLVKSEGMGGILGFGKKGQHGVEYFVRLENGAEVSVPFVFGRNGWAEYPLNKNPLLKTKRRRGDANIVWELRPLDNAELNKVTAIAESYFGQ